MTQVFFNKANAEIVKTDKYYFDFLNDQTLRCVDENENGGKKKNVHDFRFLTKTFSSLL